MLIRTILALKNGRLTKKFSTALAQKDVVLSTLDPADNVFGQIPHMNCDIAVVDDRLLEPATEDKIRTIKRLPESPEIIVVTDNNDSQKREQLIAAGCSAVLHRDIRSAELSGVLNSVIRHRLEAEGSLISDKTAFPQPSLSDFVSTSSAMQSFMRVVERIIPTTTSLLILGETGVGKERLARAIHTEGPRSRNPFIAVNCGAMPESLMESELFGHEEGAFTGATRSRRGCFELAHNGTLFLDEIGDMPFHLQIKLLRVLQEQEIQRVGSERPLSVNVRVIAATSKNLDRAIAEKTFRADLYYRLSVITLNVPPLRNRREDIPDLVESYINYFRPTLGHHVENIDSDVLDALCSYSWPGNVRELINVIERALILCEGSDLTLRELPDSIRDESDVPEPGARDVLRLPRGWDKAPLKDITARITGDLERRYITRLLKETRGRIGTAAQRAGIRSRSLFNKMKKHGIDKETFKD